MRERLQAGYVYEAGGRWYVRYRRTEMKDGKPQRVQVSEFLCDKDKVYYSTDCRALRLKRDEFMLRVNQKRVTSDTTVADFWSSTYLPFAEKTVRQSALGPYKQIWNRHLKDHFGNVALRDYKTSDMYRHLLAKLHSEKLGRRTINHIRTVASAVFQHATNIGACDMNPIRGMKLSKLPEPAETQHYTLDEAEHIINALVDRTDAQLLFALTFYMALRPSEAVALLWSDIDAETLNVRRSCVRGVLGPCKTLESQAPLPIIRQVALLLAAWRPRCPATREGWIFPRVGHHGLSGCMDLRHFCRTILKPIVVAAGLRYAGLYAGRRGGITAVIELTGSLVPGQELARHKSMVTTAQFYKKRTQTALMKGMKLLEGASKQARD